MQAHNVDCYTQVITLQKLLADANKESIGNKGETVGCNIRKTKPGKLSVTNMDIGSGETGLMFIV